MLAWLTLPPVSRCRRSRRRSSVPAVSPNTGWPDARSDGAGWEDCDAHQDERREGDDDAPGQGTCQTSHEGRAADDAGQGWSSDDEGSSDHPETQDGSASPSASVKARTAGSELDGDQPELCQPAVHQQQEDNHPEPEETRGPA